MDISALWSLLYVKCIVNFVLLENTNPEYASFPDFMVLIDPKININYQSLNPTLYLKLWGCQYEVVTTEVNKSISGDSISERYIQHVLTKITVLIT